MDRVVDIETDGLFLAVHRGFLTVNAAGEERRRVALDDIGALIVHAHGTTWSTSVFTPERARRASRHLRHQSRTGRDRLAAGRPSPARGENACPDRREQAAFQAALAADRRCQDPYAGRSAVAKWSRGRRLCHAGAQGALGRSRQYRSATARRYWKSLFGPAFSRDQDAGDINGLLNYGYTVLRAILSRAICAAGLHPTIGIFHSNRANAFALSDDLMEPYRPLVDQLVFDMVAEGQTAVNPETKLALTRIATLDLPSSQGTSPLSVQAQRFVHSLAVSFETGLPLLDLPNAPSRGVAPVLEDAFDDATGT